MSFQQQGNVSQQGQQPRMGQQSQQQQGQKGQCQFGLDMEDAVLVLIDHQSGVLNLVRDMDVVLLRQNVLALVKAAKLAEVPVILTALNEDGPHGQLLTEFDELIPDAHFVHRKTEINPWDCQKFVQTIEKLNKKTLIMAGTLANVTLASTAIAATCCGYKVFAVLDACGASTKIARHITLSRFILHDVVPIDTLSIIALFMKDMGRDDKYQWWNVMSDVLPRYKLLIDTFCKGSTGQQQQQQQGQKGQLQGQQDKFQRSQQQQRGQYGQQSGYSGQQQQGWDEDTDILSARRSGGQQQGRFDQQQDVYQQDKWR
jgi:nicotinamidase-related amidase